MHVPSSPDDDRTDACALVPEDLRIEFQPNRQQLLELLSIGYEETSFDQLLYLDIDEAVEDFADEETLSFVVTAPMPYFPSFSVFDEMDADVDVEGARTDRSASDAIPAWAGEPQRRAVAAFIGTLSEPSKGVLKGKTVCDLQYVLSDRMVDHDEMEGWIHHQLKELVRQRRFDVLRAILSVDDTKNERYLWAQGFEFHRYNRDFNRMMMIWPPLEQSDHSRSPSS